MPVLVQNIVKPSPTREFALIYSLSATSFEAPIALEGFTALSLLVRITFFTLFIIANSITFCVP